MSRRDRRALNSQERSSVAWFLDQAGRIPLLTHEEEILLGRSVQAMMRLLREKPDGPYDGDEKRILRTGKRAKDRFIKANLRLVVNVAKKYLVAVRTLELSDLIQEGMFGLIRGVEKFDPERGYKGSTYFYWWIRQGVSRAISQQDRSIRLPVNAIDCLNKLRVWMPQFFRENGRMPSHEECAEHVGISPPVMRHYLQHMVGTVSLDQQCRNDEDASNILDMVASSDTNTLEAVETSADCERVAAALDLLDEKTRELVELHYGLNGKPAVTLAELGRTLGCSREAVRQTIKRASNKIRFHLGQTTLLQEDLFRSGRMRDRMRPTTTMIHRQQVAA